MFDNLPFSNNPIASHSDRAATSESRRLVVPARGFGRDVFVGGAGGQHYRVIDLSLLTHPVEIVWSGPDSGTITDGVDDLVFQGVEEIIEPDCMRVSADPFANVANLAAYLNR